MQTPAPLTSALLVSAFLALAGPSVLAAAAVGPVAAFDFSPDFPMVFEPVFFTDHSEAGDAAIVAWSWDLGDGTQSDEQEPVHVYLDGGWFLVALTVTDDAGLQDSASTWLRVCDPLVDMASDIDLNRIRLDGHGCVRVDAPQVPSP